MLCNGCANPINCVNLGHCYMSTGTRSTVHVSALDKQVSGNHYKDKGIQPIVYIHANNLGFCEGNVIKYVTRHKDKNGAADIKKAIHYLELLLELQYQDKTSST
jgi:hypothetical protein